MRMQLNLLQAASKKSVECMVFVISVQHLQFKKSEFLGVRDQFSLSCFLVPSTNKVLFFEGGGGGERYKTLLLIVSTPRVLKECLRMFYKKLEKEGGRIELGWFFNVLHVPGLLSTKK